MTDLIDSLGQAGGSAVSAPIAQSNRESEIFNTVKGSVADKMLPDHRNEETKTGSKPGSLQGNRFGAPPNYGGVKPSMEDIKEQDSEQE